MFVLFTFEDFLEELLALPAQIIFNALVASEGDYRLGSVEFTDSHLFPLQIIPAFEILARQAHGRQQVHIFVFRVVLAVIVYARSSFFAHTHLCFVLLV